MANRAHLLKENCLPRRLFSSKITPIVSSLTWSQIDIKLPSWKEGLHLNHSISKNIYNCWLNWSACHCPDTSNANPPRKAGSKGVTSVIFPESSLISISENRRMRRLRHMQSWGYWKTMPKRVPIHKQHVSQSGNIVSIQGSVQLCRQVLILKLAINVLSTT